MSQSGYWGIIRFENRGVLGYNVARGNVLDVRNWRVIWEPICRLSVYVRRYTCVTELPKSSEILLRY